MKANLPPRRLVPRWRKTKVALEMPEATFNTSRAKSGLALESSNLDQAIAAWKSSPTTGLLGDILSYSIDPTLERQIIDLILADKSLRSFATPTQLHFIQQLSSVDSEDHESPYDLGSMRANLEVCNPFVRKEVANLRSALRANPNNPLALLDLAQFQLAGGQKKRAERTLSSALSLSPDSRIALRTLARLHVHNSEPEKAHALISKHLRTAFDPWLMATEIALAEVADLPSKFAKRGFKFVRDKEASPAHFSELAGALGSSELKAGNVRRGRDMFRLALLAPNDNVMAQAVTNQNVLGLDLSAPQQKTALISAHEAQTIMAWNSLDCDNAELHGLVWHQEEPFSSRPLQFLTSLYAAQRNYQAASTLARRGLLSDPKDPSLIANLAYVSACMGNAETSERLLYKLISFKQPRYIGVALATAGLMAMQEQSWDVGDEFYETAMRLFRARREFVFEALCCAYFARSATDTNHPNRAAILDQATALYAKHPSADAAVVLRLLDLNVQPALDLRGRRRLSQWVFDAKTESLIQLHGVTSEGASPLIVRDSK